MNLSPSAASSRNILMSGWRALPQSYAVVTQSECLEILRRGEPYRLYFEDAPYHYPSWAPMTGLFDERSEALMRALAPAPAGTRLDAELRRSFPHDFLAAPRGRRTSVFVTAEALTVRRGSVAGNQLLHDAQRRHGLGVLTPSGWSREGLLRCGLPEEAVAVVPHGFDPAVFRPAPGPDRERLRAHLGFRDDDFVFFHAGVMTFNKGLRFLLPAFARLAQARPGARLLLKGTDALYPSRDLLQGSLGELQGDALAQVLERMLYVGETTSFEGMAALYRAADCYVAPYVAEGFCMPVLEAAACGSPVICTAGGPTDDFVADEFALRVESERQELVNVDTGGAPPAVGLIPSVEHLTHVMLRMVDDAEFRVAAREAGPAHVQGFTWERVVDRLLQYLLTASR